MSVDEVVEAVLDHYLDAVRRDDRNDETSTVKTLSARLGWKEARVRRVLDTVCGHDGGWTRIVPCDAVIDVRERNYGTVVCQRTVQGYEPTKRYLARLLAKKESGGG